ncbi:MAG: galactosyldiacylglycerol synthase [Anaerolineae bacterium]|nr:galactosyldiacylglycerol synthase [Anaerolineae bacterium]MDX9830744.1 galactosyldiacylglycerol synthase [Anaerolineae bacterium]
MIRLTDSESGKPIGTISEAQLEVLQAQLEEEDSGDQDYYIDTGTLVWFESEDIDATLTALLRQALGTREGMEIRWTRD